MGLPYKPPVCRRPECDKPTWNGKFAEYCSKGPGSCMDEHKLALGFAKCIRPDCMRPAFNGKMGEFCGDYCKSQGPIAISPKSQDPTAISAGGQNASVPVTAA